MSIKSETFRTELDTITNSNIRQFCIDMLEDAPDYFFTVPASSTGKYHPKFAQGEQGLIRHTKALVGIANDLLALEQFDFDNDTKDMIRVAGILHDAKKHGDNGALIRFLIILLSQLNGFVTAEVKLSRRRIKTK